jgi:hypothetical protein
MYTFIYKQLIEHTSGVLWTLSIALSLLLHNILKAGSLFVFGQKWGRVIMLYRACMKELLSISEPQGQAGNIHLPHFHLKMKTGPFFLKHYGVR